MINQDLLKEVMALPIGKGSHEDLAQGMCIMEAASYIAGEPWSDKPKCISKVITSFMVSWNDSLPTDDDRDRLLKPLLPKIIGTRTTDADDERRSYMAFDWLVRVHTPAFLDLTEGLKPHAEALRKLPEILDIAGATAAGELARVARAAAWTAASAAAGAAAWTAAEAAWTAAEAARAAAGAAAWTAAEAAEAAEAAARAAAWTAAEAAEAAARAAAWTAASAAAGDALKPTVTELQDSAVKLVERMSEVGR